MKNLLSLAFFIASVCAYAQNNYSGIVINEKNEPLNGATIQSKTNLNNTAITDIQGNFSISLENSNEVIVRFIGFKTAEFQLKKEENTLVLVTNDELLEEVVISASREAQKRKEVPASISTITAKEIKETKAFGIDQLVNNVPGVVMSTSRAASNEQHFMSVRSPISTKSLFLYVEDGLPIRPTAVFKHNALLEMNDTSYERVEVVKGPSSSIYGSEAIGGSFNFITKTPTRNLTGEAGLQTNDLGLRKFNLGLSKYIGEKTGLYVGGQYAERKDGLVAYSDYEKFAITLKSVTDFNSLLNLTNVVDFIDYRSDMTGSLSESDYTSGNFESDQTFTERDAYAFRLRSTLSKRWNDNNKTAFNLVYRNNEMGQNPSYRIRQFREQGQLTGFGSGELNSNQFESYVALIQHKLNFDFANSSLIIGTTADFSPQRYVAETLSVIVDTNTGQNIDFTLNSGDYILNYEASIFNYAGYAQFELNPIDPLKITAALRYDGFNYDFENLIVGGLENSKNNFNNLSPKLGVNYNVSKNFGLYSNYSNGFTPPQASTLYRNRNETVGIKPSSYDNIELGTYFGVANKLKVDAALYVLDGKNTLITLRDLDDNFFNTNAGKTRSYGIEYGVNYSPITAITISHNGSYSKHEYINFFDGGIDYSSTDRETAPKLLGTSKVTYKFKKIKGLQLGLTHELVGKYNTSFEGQAENEDGTPETSLYDGHSIFNALVSYDVKGFEIWLHGLNVFDDLYAARASFNRFRGENSYTIGNPRAFHVGVRYNL